MKVIYKEEYPKIIELYLRENKSLKEIGLLYNVKSEATIYNILKKNNIKLRSKSESVKLSFKNRNVWNKNIKIKDNKDIYDRMYSSDKNKKASERTKGKSWEERYGEDKSKKMREKLKSSLKGNKFINSGQFKERDIRIIGSNNINWNGGSSFEPYDEKFNESFRKLIRKRDNQVCMLCGIHREKLNRALDVHHINYDKLLTIPENCISLCTSCHIKTNSNRESWIDFFKSVMSRIYGYKY